MREPADGTQEVIRAIECSEDGDVIGKRKILIVTEQEENRHVLLVVVGCSQNCGSFLGADGVAQDEQIKRTLSEDSVDSVVRTGAHIETSPQQEQLTCLQQEGVMPVDKNLMRHTAKVAMEIQR